MPTTALAASAAALPDRSGAALLHLLRRTGFGITRKEWRLAERLGFEAWLERQLDFTSIDDSAVEALIADHLPTVAMTTEEIQARANDGEFDPQQVAAELKLATIARALFSPRRLFETLVEFWSNHFNVAHQDVETRILKTADDRDVIRAHAMGRFADLLDASARSPAMLMYLDNASNTVDGPNENYARELLELHTLGVEGGYGETDVRELARCLTGWGVSRRPVRGLFQFYPRSHDQGEKSLLGVTIAAGGGMEDAQTILDLLAAHPSTAWHLAEKLCRRFVADDPDPSLVEQVAQRFGDSGGDVRETLREIFYSDAFLAAAGVKLKRPLELLASAVAALGVAPDAGAVRPLRGSLRLLGHLPFDWTPPTGYPDRASAWVSSSALINRWNQSFVLGAGRMPGLTVDFSAYTAAAADAEGLADLLIDGLLHAPMGDAERATLVDVMAAGGRRFRDLAPAAAALIVASPDFQYR